MKKNRLPTLFYKKRFVPAILTASLCLFLSACFNEANEQATIDLGTVSIGDQLIDLQKAREAGAISGKEFRKAKADALLLLENAARSSQGDEDGDGKEKDNEKDDEDDDDDDDYDKDDDKDDDESDFLF